MRMILAHTWADSTYDVLFLQHTGKIVLFFRPVEDGMFMSCTGMLVEYVEIYSCYSEVNDHFISLLVKNQHACSKADDT